MRHTRTIHIAICLICFWVANTSAQDTPKAAPKTLTVLAGAFQETIDAAPPYSTILCNPNQTFERNTPIIINKPLTLKGLNAKVPDGLGKSSLLILESPNVTVQDFKLYGNYGTIPETERAPLIVVRADKFVIERGEFVNGSKDGINVLGFKDESGVFDGGIMRDIVGRNMGRDVISIDGRGKGLQNLLVENIRCYTSYNRGAVEVSDGSHNVTVRNIYAENSLYAVDVQEHAHEQIANTNITVENVYAKNCKHILRTANAPHGHSGLTIVGLTGDNCAQPIHIKNTEQVILRDVRIWNHPDSSHAIIVDNCVGVKIENITLKNTDFSGIAMLIQNTDHTNINGFTILGNVPNLKTGITYRLKSDRAFTNLQIQNVSTPKLQDKGIILEAPATKGTLEHYHIAQNFTTIRDDIKGKNGIVIPTTK